MEWEQPSTSESKQSAGPAQAGALFFMALTVLVLLCYVAIFANPQVIFNPFKPPSVVFPTLVVDQAAATPTVPPTFTPPSTYPPTWTPTATHTPTMTPTPTPTPTPTFTPGPVPPFSVYWGPANVSQKLYTGTESWWMGVAGEVADKAKNPVTDVTIKVWDDFGHVWEVKPGNADAYAGENGYGSEYGGRGTYAWWEQFLFTSCQESITIHVQVIRGGSGVSKIVTTKTSGDCEKNLTLIHFVKNY